VIARTFPIEEVRQVLAALLGRSPQG